MSVSDNDTTPNLFHRHVQRSSDYSEMGVELRHVSTNRARTTVPECMRNENHVYLFIYFIIIVFFFFLRMFKDQQIILLLFILRYVLWTW